MIKTNDKELISESEVVNVTEPYKGIMYSDQERDVLLFIKERYDRMVEKKKELGIDYKCDLYDKLYTPHRVLKIKNYDKESENAHLALDDDDSRKATKSKPIAFEKVQTALATIIKENPKAFMKARNNKWKALNEIVKSCYEQNWDDNRLLIELRKFVFHMAKYGVAYGRRYIKKEYKVVHTEDGKLERVLKFYDSVWETIHPKKILLDEACDNPRNARDFFLVEHLNINQIKDVYPIEVYDRVRYITVGSWLTEGDNNYMSFEKTTRKSDDNTYEVLTYENEYKDVKLVVINGVLISEPDEPLPGHQLSLFGEKWADKDETYDGIGICEILENYQPLIDDISNADIDLVREVIRPKLYIGSGIQLSDEPVDTVDGQQIIKFEGDINNQLVFQRPTRTGDATQMLEFLGQEIDDSTGIARDLSAISEAKTLGQASFNRENSLRRLSLPLESIKYAIEDDANKALPLFKIMNATPIDTYEIIDQTEMLEASAIIRQDPDDERFVLMSDGKLFRRLFREAELGVDFNQDEKTFIQSDTKRFWEMIPSTFEWKGKINIIPMSFLGESQAMQMEAAMQDMNLLLGIQDVDQVGMPVLKDEQGVPYKINRLKVIRDYLRARSKDPEEYLMELSIQNIAGTNDSNTLTNPDNLTPNAGDVQGTGANV